MSSTQWNCRTRTCRELGWEPRFSSREGLTEVLDGTRDRAGAATDPLSPDSAGSRRHELATGGGSPLSRAAAAAASGPGTGILTRLMTRCEQLIGLSTGAGRRHRDG